MPSRSTGQSMITATIRNLVVPLSALATAPILAYSLGVEERGELAAATVPLFLFISLASVGLPEATTYLVARGRVHARDVTRFAVILSLGTGLIGTLVAFWLAPWLTDNDERVTQLVMLATWALIPTLLVGCLRGYASGLHEWRLVNTEKYIGAAIKLVGIGGLALVGELTLEGAVVVTAVAPVLGGLAYAPLSRVAQPQIAPMPHRRDMMSYGSRIWMGAVAGVLLARIDQMLLLPLSSAYQLGLYVAAVTIGDVVALANNAVREVTLASEARETSRDRLQRAARISLFVSVLVGLVVIAILPWFLPLMFGPEFGPAYSATVLVIAATALGVPGSVAGAGLSGRGRPGLRSVSLIFGALVNVLLVVILVPEYGALGAALATLAGSLIAANLNIVFLAVMYKFPVVDFYAVRFADVRFLCVRLTAFFKRNNGGGTLVS